MKPNTIIYDARERNFLRYHTTHTEFMAYDEVAKLATVGLNDHLPRMFELQRQFNLRLGLDTDDITAEIANGNASDRIHGEALRDMWLGRMHLALSQELAEFRDSVPWKWWKAQEADLQNAKVEVVDMMHFLISMAQLLGMTPEDFLRVYEQKMAVNNARQNKGYGTDPKAEGGSTDCRHIS